MGNRDTVHFSTAGLADIEAIRADFPILRREVYGKPLVYFDNAATTQKPQVVIDALTGYYQTMNANVHRGVHLLSQEATSAFEKAREKLALFVNARSVREMVFTRGCTESINLVAATWGQQNLRPGDEILISALEHHSNIVPWQMLCEHSGARLIVCPLHADGSLNMEEFARLLNTHTRLVAISHISNSLGTINPVKEITRMAHKTGAKVLIDGAQALAHLVVDVQDMDCDFYTFSAHKIYGPMGIGGLYGKEELLLEMPPYQGGGEMIANVTFEHTSYNEPPFKFEAGTPNVAGALAFGVAIDYIQKLGIQNIAKRENQLLDYATQVLKSIPGVVIIGNAEHKASVISFLIDEIHPYDAGTIIDHFGIAVRTGTHCTQPLMDSLGITGTIRASFAFYNTFAEIDLLAKAINKAKEMFL
ncbi:MAG: cysteine desulfurase [Lentimicrobium sp.]|jgi:cysteine desulfurase/selenocysteine lyase|nr:cysteine desulfurase [Lentimicrobium sp.]MDD2529147.1 cysteine desulfurase [Lentimicrobiaceae bacterium]MDD4599183.1 cysteine desulfurase [Lentimicrobiaceae bacterium]MDY0026068.1 cysteine desulfurase [Lentimicrobium sp.]